MKVNEFIKAMGLLKKGTKDTYSICSNSPLMVGTDYRLVKDDDGIPYYRSTNYVSYSAVIKDHKLTCVESYNAMCILNDIDVSSITTETKDGHNHYTIFSNNITSNDITVERCNRDLSELNNVRINTTLEKLYLNDLYKLDEATDLTRNDNPTIEFISMNDKVLPDEEVEKLKASNNRIIWFSYDQDKHHLKVGLNYVYFNQEDASRVGMDTIPPRFIPPAEIAMYGGYGMSHDFMIPKPPFNIPLDKQYPELFKPMPCTSNPDSEEDDDEDDDLLCHWDDGCPVEDEEESEPIDVEIHRDEYKAERKVSMLYIAEVKVKDTKYILHIYSPSEDMVESLVFVFVNDIGYTDDDVSEVNIHTCGELLDKKVDNVLFGGEDEAYPADYDIIGIYDDDADKLTVYIDKNQEEK